MAKKEVVIKVKTSGAAKVSEDLKNISGEIGDLPGPLGSAADGVKGLSSAFKALLANPVILVIGGITGALGLLYKAFTRSETGQNRVNKGMNLLKAGATKLLQVLEPLANFIADYIVKGLDDMATTVDVVSDGMEKLLRKMNRPEWTFWADKMRDAKTATKELVAATNDISDAEAKLVKQRRELGVIQKQELIDAEKQRQIRDDTSKSTRERIAANEKLGEILTKGGADEARIAQANLDIINKKLKLDKDNTELLDEQAAATVELLDIEERIGGFRSEQMTNAVGLRKEQADAAKEAKTIAAAAAAEEAKRQIDLQKTIEDSKVALMKEGLEKEIAEIQLAGERRRAAILGDTLLDREARTLIGQETEALKLEAINKAAEDTAANQKIIDDKILQTNYDNNLKELDNEKKTAAAKKQIADAEISQKRQAAAAVGSILSSVAEEAGKETAAGKALAIAATTISTYQSAQSAYASAFLPVPTIASPAIGAISAAAAVTAGLLNVKKILSVKVPGKSSGGGGGSAPIPQSNIQLPSAPASAPTAPSLFGSGESQTETVGSAAGGLNQQVIKAVVVESDMTNTQKRLDSFHQRSQVG